MHCSLQLSHHISSYYWFLGRLYIALCCYLITHSYNMLLGRLCTFLFWMVCVGIWDRCIVGFVRLAHSKEFMGIWRSISLYTTKMHLNICHLTGHCYIVNGPFPDWVSRSVVFFFRIICNSILMHLWCLQRHWWPANTFIDGLVQDCSNSIANIANALGLLQSCIKLSILCTYLLRSCFTSCLIDIASLFHAVLNFTSIIG